MSQDVFENAALLNQYMTNEKFSMLIGNVKMEIMWLSFPVPSGQPQKKKDTFPAKMHSHSFREAHYCTSGTMICCTSDGREYVVKSGETILICENVMHSCRYNSEESQRISIAYRVEGASDPYGIGRHESEEQENIIVVSQADEIYQLFCKISNEFDHQSICYREVIQTLLFQIAMKYERLTVKEENNKEYIERIDSRVEEMVLFINSNIHNNISTIDIAEHMHISKRQISRIIMKEFHMSCEDLIQSIKLRKAQELLMCTDESIENIASMVGYSNVFSFSKFFKKHEGMPPALFRKSHYSY